MSNNQNMFEKNAKFKKNINKNQKKKQANREINKQS